MTHRASRVVQVVVAVGVISLGLAPVGAGAWPGDPDGSFGACGVSGLDVGAGTPSVAGAASLQTDGKVLLAGAADDRGLAMRLTDGHADPTFGTSGQTRVRFAGATRFVAVAPTAAGGAVLAGSRTDGTTVDTVVVKLRANGRVDPAFHGNGKVSVDLGGSDTARAVAALTDGSVVIAGSASGGGFVAKYSPNGTLDAGWDGDGRVTGLPLMARSVAVRADGSVYVGGSTPTGSADWRIVRLAPDGSVDATFGGSSGMTVNVGGQDVVTAIVLQPDGKVVAAGYGKGAPGHGQTIVRRYLDDGTPDTSFSAYRDALGVNDAPSALTRQSDGRIVVAVNSRVGTDNDVVLVRLGDDGVPDDGFGIGGVSVVDAGRRSVVNGVVVPPDGRALAVGSVRRGSVNVVGLFRFQPDSSSIGIPAQGIVADGFGGLHGWSSGCLSAPTGFVGGGYWPGWDIIRGVATVPGGGGMMVDGFGGIHPFKFGDGAAPVVSGAAYWPGWDIARGVVTVPDGSGGFVLDAFGGLHAFSIGGGPKPVVPARAPYWPGMDFARGVALTPDGDGGYIVDLTGVIHAFGNALAPNPGGPSWPGQDVARGIALSPDGSGGWIVDRFGGLHPFGTGGDPAPTAAIGGPYWPGVAIARGVTTLP